MSSMSQLEVTRGGTPAAGDTRLRRLRGALALIGLVAALGGTTPAWTAPERVAPLAPSAVAPNPGAVAAVEAISIPVSDLDRAVDFYTRVLSFEKVSEQEVAGEPLERLSGVFGLRVRSARLRLGDEWIELREPMTPRGRPVPEDSRSNDAWFQHIAIIVRDMDAAYVRLREFDVEYASTAPQTLPAWNRNAAGIRAFYFKDPDHHALEILWFPPGKGDPKWQRPTDRLFLGIDHTAIVVSDTEASLSFYRDRLGLRVVGGSENHGTEQEHLNNVFGAHLRITTLKAAAGPGIEFLEYLAPRDGRATPAGKTSVDLIDWQTHLTVTSLALLAPTLDGLNRPFTRAAVAQAGGTPRAGTALLVRDPDGHTLQLIEPVSTVSNAGSGDRSR